MTVDLSGNKAVIKTFASGKPLHWPRNSAFDDKGNLYIAAGISRSRGPHESGDIPPGIWVITPDGEVKGRIPIVEDVLTNVTFGGDDLKTLYIAAGKTLFTTRVEIPGWVVHRRNGS